MPAPWLWFFDEILPNWVKQKYSPKENWKSKPFSEEDARFFLRGVRELSDLFVETGTRKQPNYLSHPRFRSSYLLYFLPLQAAKFVTLFEQQPEACRAVMEHGKSKKSVVVFDVGAGPATASIAFLLYLLGKREEFPDHIEFVLFDQNSGILSDGKELLEKLAESFPKSRSKVTVRMVIGDHWNTLFRESNPASLVLFGHTLNENLPLDSNGIDLSLFKKLFSDVVSGGGVLFAEPAAKSSSQTLSKLRDLLLSEGVVDAHPNRIWGPCLHAGLCPLKSGRDWCHTSIPGKIPGKWFKFFSKGLSKEKEWLKLSYLWLSSADFPKEETLPTDARRVVSDDLQKRTAQKSEFLLCEPDRTRRYEIRSRTERPKRGDLIYISAPKTLGRKN